MTLAEWWEWRHVLFTSLVETVGETPAVVVGAVLVIVAILIVRK